MNPTTLPPIEAPNTTSGTASDEYHLQIARIHRDCLIDRSYQQDINKFLETLFDPHGSGLKRSPLHFDEQYLEHMNTDIYLVNCVRIRFRLTDGTESSRNTLGEAIESFCQHIFDPWAENGLMRLTTLGILGFSPLSPLFTRHWMRICFADCAINGPRLLERAGKGFDNYLPEWALALSFTAVVGPDLRIFCVPESPTIASPSTNDGFCLGSSILTKYARKITRDFRKGEEVCVRELVKRVQELADRLKIEKNFTVASRDVNLNKVKMLWKSLDDFRDLFYETTIAAAKIITSNKKFLKRFLTLPRPAKKRNYDSNMWIAMDIIIVPLDIAMNVSRVVSTAMGGTDSRLTAAACLALTGCVLSIKSWRAQVIAIPKKVPWLLYNTLKFTVGSVVTIYGVVSVWTKYDEWAWSRLRPTLALERANIVMLEAYKLAHEAHAMLPLIHIADGEVKFVDEDSHRRYINLVGTETSAPNSDGEYVLYHLEREAEHLRASAAFMSTLVQPSGPMRFTLVT